LGTARWYVPKTAQARKPGPRVADLGGGPPVWWPAEHHGGGKPVSGKGYETVQSRARQLVSGYLGSPARRWNGGDPKTAPVRPRARGWAEWCPGVVPIFRSNWKMGYPSGVQAWPLRGGDCSKTGPQKKTEPGEAGPDATDEPRKNPSSGRRNRGMGGTGWWDRRKRTKNKGAVTVAPRTGGGTAQHHRAQAWKAGRVLAW